MGPPSETAREEKKFEFAFTLNCSAVPTHSPDSLCAEGCVGGTADDTDAIKCNRNSDRFCDLKFCVYIPTHHSQLIPYVRRWEVEESQTL